MKNILVIFFLGFSSFKSIAGLIIDVRGYLYDVSTVTGLLSQHRSTIEQQVWYGNSELAREFSNTVKTDIFAPHNLGLGPAFGYSVYDGVGADYTTAWFYKNSNSHLPIGMRAQTQNASAGVYYTYAVATRMSPLSVHEPNNITLLFIALFFMTLINKKLQLTRYLSSLNK